MHGKNINQSTRILGCTPLFQQVATEKNPKHSW
jgi:hypothetical protein